MPDKSKPVDFLVIPPSVWDACTLNVQRVLMSLGEAGVIVLLIMLCVLLKCLVES